jgi:hypothetical protein
MYSFVRLAFESKIVINDKGIQPVFLGYYLNITSTPQ